MRKDHAGPAGAFEKAIEEIVGAVVTGLLDDLIERLEPLGGLLRVQVFPSRNLGLEHSEPGSIFNITPEVTDSGAGRQACGVCGLADGIRRQGSSLHEFGWGRATYYIDKQGFASKTWNENGFDLLEMVWNPLRVVFIFLERLGSA